MTVSSAYLFACLKSWYAYFQESLISFPVGDQKYQNQPSKKASNAVALSDEQSWADPAPARQSTEQRKVWKPTLLLKLSLHTLGVVLDILVTSSVPHDTDDCADNDGSSSNELQNRRSDFNLLYPFVHVLGQTLLIVQSLEGQATVSSQSRLLPSNKTASASGSRSGKSERSGISSTRAKA